MNYILAFLIGATSGIAAALVTSVLAFRSTVWQQRRLDYGQLLLALSKRNPEEILNRLELVALVGSDKVRMRAVSTKSELMTLPKTATSVDESLCAQWHSTMFELMRTDIQRSCFWRR